MLRDLKVAWALAAFSVILVSCNERQAVPTSPGPPTPVEPMPGPPPTEPGRFPHSLTGVVYQSTHEGRRPVVGATVFAVDLIDGPYGDAWYQSMTDDQGQFSFALKSREFKITAYAGEGFGLWNHSGLSQVTAVHRHVEGTTRVDIELVQAGVLPRVTDSPLLSGTIFESTADGLRPAADMAVLYSSHGHDGADVYMRTDRDGRYRFYNLPLGNGYLLPACTRATTLQPNLPLKIVPIDIQGDTVLNASCP